MTYLYGIIFALFMLWAAIYIQHITESLPLSSTCGFCGRRLPMNGAAEHLILCSQREEMIPVQEAVMETLEHLRANWRTA